MLLIIAFNVILARSASFFFRICFFTPGVAGGGGGAEEGSAGAAATVLAGGFDAFIGFGLVMRAGLLSGGGAAFLDSVFGGAKISSIALVSFFFGPLPVDSSFASLFCCVSVSMMLVVSFSVRSGLLVVLISE